MKLAENSAFPLQLQPNAFIARLAMELMTSESNYLMARSFLDNAREVSGDLLSPTVNLPKALMQFMRETRNLTAAQNERRFVLFYGSQNASLDRLRIILNRSRGLPQGTSLTSAITSQRDRQIVEELNLLLDSLFSMLEFEDSDLDRETLLRHTYLKWLDIAQGRSDNLNLIDSMRRNLLSTPDQVSLAMKEFHQIADDLMELKGSVNRNEIRRRLKNIGVELTDSVTFQPDFRRLDDWTQNQVASAEARGDHRLKLGEQELIIARPVVDEMLRLVPGNSFLVVGDAGVGKTGCLLSLARGLIANGIRVWYFPANSQVRSAQDIANEIHLQHRWKELLDDASSGIQPVIIIDGLDSLRQTEAIRAYRDLMVAAKSCGLTVVASIRGLISRLRLSCEISSKGGASPFQAGLRTTCSEQFAI